MDGLTFNNEYNRVAGAKANYLSKKRKWSGFGTYSHSFSDEVSRERTRIFCRK